MICFGEYMRTYLLFSGEKNLFRSFEGIGSLCSDVIYKDIQFSLM
jgi:hypothetical protein